MALRRKRNFRAIFTCGVGLGRDLDPARVRLYTLAGSSFKSWATSSRVRTASVSLSGNTRASKVHQLPWRSRSRVPLVAKVQGADILVEVNGNFTIGGPIGSPRLNS